MLFITFSPQRMWNRSKAEICMVEVVKLPKQTRYVTAALRLVVKRQYIVSDYKSLQSPEYFTSWVFLTFYFIKYPQIKYHLLL